MRESQEQVGNPLLIPSGTRGWSQVYSDIFIPRKRKALRQTAGWQTFLCSDDDYVCLGCTFIFNGDVAGRALGSEAWFFAFYITRETNLAWFCASRLLGALKHCLVGCPCSRVLPVHTGPASAIRICVSRGWLHWMWCTPELQPNNVVVCEQQLSEIKYMKRLWEWRAPAMGWTTLSLKSAHGLVLKACKRRENPLPWGKSSSTSFVITSTFSKLLELSFCKNGKTNPHGKEKVPYLTDQTQPFPRETKSTLKIVAAIT